MTDVGLLAAFAAGLLALLSPCSALLLPSFFAYAFAAPTTLVLRTGVFYGGLLLTLVPLGVGASAASQLFYGHRSTLIAVAGWTIIALGVLQLLRGGFTIPGTPRLNAWAQRAGGGSGTWLSTLVLGAVYGLAGFCSGPVLGAILTVAATRSSPWAGGGLLAVYALGMAAPLLVMALLWDRYRLGERRLLRGRTLTLSRLRIHSTTLLSGTFFVLIGALFLRYDGTAGLTGSLGFADTVDEEYDAQLAVNELLGRVPVPVVALAVAAGALLVAWRRRRRGAQTPRSDALRRDR